MTSIAETREALAAVVGTSNVYPPDRFNAPGYIIQPASPYFTPGQTFASVVVNYEVIYITTTGPMAVAGPALDSHLEDLFVALKNAGWSIEDGGSPESYSLNGVSYSGFGLTVSTEIRL